MFLLSAPTYKAAFSLDVEIISDSNTLSSAWRSFYGFKDLMMVSVLTCIKTTFLSLLCFKLHIIVVNHPLNFPFRVDKILKTKFSVFSVCLQSELTHLAHVHSFGWAAVMRLQELKGLLMNAAPQLEQKEGLCGEKAQVYGLRPWKSNRRDDLWVYLCVCGSVLQRLEWIVMKLCGC